jgi:hypothetical protein
VQERPEDHGAASTEGMVRSQCRGLVKKYGAECGIGPAADSEITWKMQKIDPSTEGADGGRIVGKTGSDLFARKITSREYPGRLSL